MAGLVTNSDAKCYYTKLSSVLFMSHKSARTVMAWLMANIQTHIHFNRWLQGRKTAQLFRLVRYLHGVYIRVHEWHTAHEWYVYAVCTYSINEHDTASLASKHKVQYTGRLQNDILTMTKYLQFRLATCPTKTKTAFILIKLFFQIFLLFPFLPSSSSLLSSHD